jgi:hypothetical protein
MKFNTTLKKHTRESAMDEAFRVSQEIIDVSDCIGRMMPDTPARRALQFAVLQLSLEVSGIWNYLANMERCPALPPCKTFRERPEELRHE